MDSLKNQLKALIKGKTALVGMGNILKADDGAGSLLIQNLWGKVSAELFDAGVTPENYLGPISKIKPKTVIIIDALHFNEPPGTVRLFREADFTTLSFSTHAMNPEFFINYLKDECTANIAFLGIQPGNISLGGRISPAVAQALVCLERVFYSLFL